MVSSGELNDVAKIAYVLGLLEMDKDSGVFLSKEDTAILSEVEASIRELLASYNNHKAKIMKRLERITYGIAFTREDFEVELTVFGLNMLYITLQETERKGKPLAITLKQFWTKIGDKVKSLIDKHYDSDEDIASDGYWFTVKLLEKI